MNNKIIIILGPTASGKTGWGIEIAKKLNGEVVCADSRTVYKYFDIATAKPEKKEMQGVKHHLLNFVNPKTKVYTVADFQCDAIKNIKDILKRKKVPIIVGGSALYIYSLIRGYKFKGKGNNRVRREFEGKSLDELQAMVKKIKNISLNSSDFKNKRRLIRAIEVDKNCKLNNKKIFFSPLPYPFLKIGIDKPREEIYRRIDKRTEVWMKNNKLIKEVKKLLNKKIPKQRIIEFGLGYREVIKYFDGEIKTSKELAERINFCQHAYVRRQMTWFRHDKEIVWCKNIKKAKSEINKFLSTI